MTARIAINGFGRIGRAAFRILQDKADVEVVCINDLGEPKVLAHLLKYDSAYGIFQKNISVEDNYLVVDDKKTLITAEKDPTLLPWQKLNVDVVIECTGRFTKDDASLAHVQAGAKKVVVSAPTDGTIPTFLKGVNADQYIGQNAISNASCTTNSLAPVISIMHKNFKILKSMMTTIHAVTAEQNLVDGAPPGLHPDLRRARSALTNMIPTTTGAAKAVTKVIPDLKDKFDGLAIRVPILVGSLSDITMLVEKKTTVDEVNNAFLEAKKNPFYKDVIDVTFEPLVSSDIVKSPFSSIVDLSLTKVVDGDLVKVMAWYDNEWGYSNRLVEMALSMC